MALFSDAGIQFLFRWIHFLSGITWIGLLYYFNFVQGPFMAEADAATKSGARSEEHTSELQSRSDLVCRLLLEKKNDCAQVSPVQSLGRCGCLAWNLVAVAVDSLGPAER